MYNKIKHYMPWNVIEFFIYFVMFVLINEYFYDGAKESFNTMIAGCALFTAIQLRRKLDNGGYK